MINIKNITIRNFMSVGNVTQGVRFDESGLTLVLGNNVDLGGDGSRNGTGKTTLVNALSYGLYGTALTNIRKDNLVNRTNNKGMLVTVEFEKDGIEYRVERGRKPNIFKFMVAGQEANADETDEGQGEGRLTQLEIEKLLGMGHVMFKHLLALNTYTEPFLSMRANDQRAMIEQLLGITMLSEKAAVLKELLKETKDSIKEEDMRNKAFADANAGIEKSIADLGRRRSIWIQKKDSDVGELEKEIFALESFDIEAELQSHVELDDYSAKKTRVDEANRWISSIQGDDVKQQRLAEKVNKEIKLLQDHKCHACGQDIHDDKQEKILNSKQEQVAEANAQMLTNSTQLQEHQAVIAEVGELGNRPKTIYATAAEAYEHFNKLSTFKNQLEEKKSQTDPYEEQIESLRSEALQEISWDQMNNLTQLRDHQEFLMKLLTNKDSFIRKQIIEQNLSYLNQRLGYFLAKLGLPHDVSFQPDLTVEITELGRELDFDNLSRGERNRLILGLSWAFRNVYESMNTPINLMCIDELVDSGMDANGVEAALEVLKKMVREQNKNVFLISHRDELVGRVSHTLQVIKENGFTTFDTDVEDTGADGKG
jgi:energy-coupling factor transporter ATP-binding protein EcfA2